MLTPTRRAAGSRGPVAIGVGPRAIVAVVVALGLAVAPGSSSLAATTLPTLWTAGGLDAGTTGAGQAARITADSFDNVAVVSGPAGRDLAVTSYTPGGALRWRRTVSPSSGTFAGDWIVAAPDDDLVAVGHNVNSTGAPIALALVRYGSDGTLRWRVDIARTLPAVARLLVDAAGDSYLAFNSLGDGQDIQVHKYDSAGVLVWSGVISTGSGAADIAASLALSADGADVVVTGSVSGGSKWITAAYDTLTGARRWLVTAAEGTAARDVVVDAARVYVTGQGVTGAGTPAVSYFLTVVAYDRATGARQWRTDRRPADASNAAGLRAVLAPDGSLAVTGQAARGFLDWYTVALESTGTVRWEAVRDGRLNTDEVPRGALALADGTTVVTGPGGPNLPGGYIPGVTAGYDSNGVLLWEAFSAQATVWATALSNGDVCATGGYDALVTCWSFAPPSLPAAPSGLSARLATGSVQLTWQDNSTDETSFSIERCTETIDCPNFVTLATVGANTTSYADTTYVAGRTINYRVRASNAAGSSAYSSTSISILSSGMPPTALIRATPSSGAAPLSVTFDGSGSTGDFGRTVIAWTWSFGDGTSGAGAVVSHLYSTPGTFTASLTVMDSSHLTGSATAPIVVTVPAPPTAPAGLAATALSRSSLLLQWANTTANQTEVWIERCKGSGCTNFAQVASVAGTATAFTDNALASRTIYTYRVRAHNAAGNSPYSTLASARTLR